MKHYAGVLTSQMNYLKGWKNKMENKTYGRKVIRQSKQAVAKRRFLIYTLTVLISGIIIGCLSWGLIKTTNTNESLMENVKNYGAYDGRILTDEISLDWSGDEYDFTPLECGMDEGTQEFVFYLCKGYELDWTLVMAVIQKESSFDPNAVGDGHDYGLMQINKINHEWLTDTLGVTDYLDSEQNIRAGVFVLRKLFEEYTDPELVLMAYNMGERGASRLWTKGIYSTRYSEDILKIQKGFVKQLEERGKENGTM